MAFTPPTAADFKVRFPGFSSVADTTVNAVLAEALGQVGDTWLERDRAPAILYLTAHLLIMEGQPAATAAAALGIVSQGRAKRVKVGDVEMEFDGAGSSSSGSTGSSSDYSATEWGRRYLQLLRQNFPPIALV